MSVGFKMDRFGGLFPRRPESLLPETGATLAQNCDFAYGELRNTKGEFLIANVLNEARSIYTDDGLTFYTWSTDVNAVRSPLANDPYNRLYYTDGTDFRVADRTGTKVNGGPPGTSYKVGVPRPTTVPDLTSQLPKLTPTNTNFKFRYHYEYGGVKYQEGELTLTPATISDLALTWNFTMPPITPQVTYATVNDFPASGVTGTIYKATDTGKLYLWDGTDYIQTNATATPASAVAVMRVTATNKADDSLIFDLYTNNSSLDPAGSEGLFSLTLTKGTAANAYVLNLNVGGSAADTVTRAYVFTYVNLYDEEGPPSDPAIISVPSLGTVLVGITKDAITGYLPIKEIRVYRTPDSTTIADYFYVGKVSALSGSTFTFQDDVKGAEINEPLSSTDNYPPPSTLRGLMSLPNGILAAWKGNELWFSDAYRPWSWPPKYVKTLKHTVVGGIVSGSGAVITTVQQPYVVSGVSPDSMSTAELNVAQAGVSKWSIAKVDGLIMYASNDGIVVLNGGAASLNQSEVFFTRDVWRSRVAGGLSSMVFSVWDGRLVVFSNTNAFTPFMIRFDEADGTMTDLPSLQAVSAFISQLSDQFYFGRGQSIYQFNGGLDQTAVWQSREAVMTRPVNYGFAQAVVTGTWSIEFYADGILRHTKMVSDGTTDFRLPSGFKATRYKIKVSGKGRFRELRVGRTAVELSGL